MDSSVTIAIIGGVFGLLGAMVAGWFAVRQTKTNATTAAKAEIIKTEVQAKATEIEITTQKETQRIDQVLDATMDLIRNLQEENRQQRNDMTSKDAQHAAELLQIRNRMNDLDKLMSVCIEERGAFKLRMEKVQGMYEVLEAQFKATDDYKKGIIADRRNAHNKKSRKITGTMEGEITEGGA